MTGMIGQQGGKGRMKWVKGIDKKTGKDKITVLDGRRGEGKEK